MSTEDKSAESSSEESRDDFDQQMDQELEETTGDVTESVTGAVVQSPETLQNSWKTAQKLVKSFRPVPWAVWIAIRGTYRKSGEVGEPGAMVFDVLDPVIKAALKDPTLGRDVEPHEANDPYISLTRSVELLGADVCASVCFLYSVCRRVQASLAERVWRPIIDDALLRAQIGYFVGGFLPEFGHGRGMLAGFSGRSGLAIQIASGQIDQAQEALESLALGLSIHDVGMSVYGCGPLQVSAMSLAAAGVSKDAAFGTASYALEDDRVEPDTPQYRWLSAFSIIEQLRVGRSEDIQPEHWRALAFEKVERQEALKGKARELLRKGHSWHWIFRSQIIKG